MGDIRIWEVPSGALAAEHEGLVAGGAAVAFNPDGTQLAARRCETGFRTDCEQETLWVWDAASGEPVTQLAEHEGILQDVVFSADGLLAAASGDGTARVWNLASGELVYTLTVSQDRAALHVIFGPNDELVTIGDGTYIGFWDAATGEPIPVPYEPPLESATNMLEPPWGVFTALVYDGDNLAIGGLDGRLYLWQRATPDIPWLQIGQDYFQRSVNSLAFANHSGDGFMAAGGVNNVVQMWNRYGGDYMGTATVHDSWIYSVAFSPPWDNYLVSAGCADSLRNPFEGSPYCAGGDLRLWTPIVPEDETFILPSAHTETIWEVAFNPAGTLMATTSEDGTIVLWGVQLVD